MRKLNIGCGNDIRKGYVNLDKFRGKGIDVVHNIDKFPWPFKDNYFDEILAQDVIEHVEDFFKAMEEIRRISRNGARINIIVPYWHSSSAFYPNHNYFFNIDSFKFFTEKARNYDGNYFMDLVSVREIPSKLGWLIPPIPLPKRFFPNALNFRHLMSYIFGEVVLRLDFHFIVRKK